MWTSLLMKMFASVLKSQCISATDKINGFRFDLKEYNIPQSQTA